MEGFKENHEAQSGKPAEISEGVYRAINPDREKQILTRFTPEQQEEIKQKQQILSSLAYFIGKDFRIPVELNEPGSGWYWDFKNNEIRIDPNDLLEKPMDYLRFVISHEGGHRRISRTDFIPVEEWKQPGFSFMMNAIEDPRDNNFVAESYPKFKDQMGLAYVEDLDFEAKAKEKADKKLGYKPRFMQAGFEYIKQWFKETKGEDFEISPDLPEDVRTVVEATLAGAQDSWWRYPSKEEADRSEDMVRKYAELSYTINRDQIWPEFKKLIEKDLEDQKMEELLKDMSASASASADKQKEGGKPTEFVPKPLKDKLSPEEQRALEETIKKAIESAAAEALADKQAKKESTEGEKSEEVSADGTPGEKPIDMDSLSEELKQKIKEYIESLPPEEQKEINEKAEKVFKEFEDALNEKLGGKLSEDPEEKAEREQKEGQRTQSQGGAPIRTGKLREDQLDLEGLRIYKERLTREINKDENVYEKNRREVLYLIEKLETELREIFVSRKITSWKGGFKTGKRIDIGKRVQEKAKDVPAMESSAWQKRERSNEKDYSVTILNDLSGSMRGIIKEDFKAKIVFAEVLNKLGLNVEILGFNDEIYEYQNFGQPMSKEIREHMGGMFKEVDDSCCKNCGNEHNETDLGWATKIAAERLEKQKTKEKILVVLTDGKSAESSKHSARDFDLSKIKQGISETNIISIDPGSIIGMSAEKITNKVSGLLKENL